MTISTRHSVELSCTGSHLCWLLASVHTVLPDGVVPVPTETSQGTLQQASGTTQDLTTPPLGRGAVGHALMQWFKPSESERSTKPNGRWFRGIVYDYDDQTKLYWVSLVTQAWS